MNCAFRVESAPNNVYPQCPALSYSGRFTTINVNTNDLTNYLQRSYDFYNNNHFRTFMQNNAEKFMRNERAYLKKNFDCKNPEGCSTGYYTILNYY